MRKLFVIKNTITNEYISAKGGWTNQLTEAMQHITEEEAKAWIPKDAHGCKIMPWDFDSYAKADELIKGCDNFMLGEIPVIPRDQAIQLAKEYGGLKIKEFLSILADDFSKKHFKTVIPFGNGRAEVDLVDVIAREDVTNVNYKFILI